MYKLIFIFLPLFCFSQIEKKEIKIPISIKDTVTVSVSPELEKDFLNFIEDAKFYHLDLKELDDLYSVILSNVIKTYVGKDSLGLTLIQKDFPNIIFINDKILLDDIKTLTLYHEMGHHLLQNINHCNSEGCPLLFNSNANNDYRGRKVFVEILYEWEKHKKEFFEYLLLKQNGE